jgi:hypothetical protein
MVVKWRGLGAGRLLDNGSHDVLQLSADTDSSQQRKTKPSCEVADHGAPPAALLSSCKRKGSPAGRSSDNPVYKPPSPNHRGAALPESRDGRGLVNICVLLLCPLAAATARPAKKQKQKQSCRWNDGRDGSTPGRASCLKVARLELWISPRCFESWVIGELQRAKIYLSRHWLIAAESSPSLCSRA